MNPNTASRTVPRGNGQRTRRPRAARACDLCRAKKNKCDESYPCSYCKSRDLQCVYEGQHPNSRRYAAEYVKQLEDEVKRLTTQVSEALVEPLPLIHDGNMPEDHDMQQQHDTNPINVITPRQAQEEDVSGVNRHTRDIEYYGSSSSVALLSQIQRTDQRRFADEEGGHLVSSLHNAAFRTTPTVADARDDNLEAEIPHIHHGPRFRGFLENFFSSIHYIHPILDKHEFLEKCEKLRSAFNDNSSNELGLSFTALYYSVLSLGAIVGVRDEEFIDGLNNLQWSRKFFDIARAQLTKLGLVTDLEMVQCYFFMAKVCQNELNPHWSYMYVGLAVRTALAMGANRDPGPNTKKHANQLRAESRTWWGLYSLETEVSFSIGRPDTLGADIYHNRTLPLVRGNSNPSQPDDSPLLEPPHCAIISCMVTFSKITRTVCQKIYLSNAALPDIMALSNQIERELDTWLESLPEAIRPQLQQQGSSLKGARDAQWVKRQRLVLNIRYHNLRILLFGSLLLRSSHAERLSVPGCQENILKCLDSAKQTINIIYQTYEHNDFFRTWFYNTTYTVFAASVILLYVSQVCVTHQEAQSTLQFINMAVEILEIMDECVVALEAAKLLRRAREKAESKLSSTGTTFYGGEAPGEPTSEHVSFSPLLAHVDGQPLQLNNYWAPLGLMDGSGMDFDIAFQLGGFDQNGPAFLS